MSYRHAFGQVPAISSDPKCTGVRPGVPLPPDCYAVPAVPAIPQPSLPSLPGDPAAVSSALRIGGGIVGPPIEPAPSAMLPMRFFGIARRIWMEPPPVVTYGPGQTLVQYPAAQPAINYEALVEYAKITAVGTFVGIPLAWWWAKRRGKVTPNRRHRRRRR